MDFLNPWLLWGTLGVLVPIVIHLLNRFRYREIDWAAMELLRRALIVRSRRIRLEDLILLILRCAAVLLIALALARPTVAPPDSEGGSTDVAAVIAVDGSFSMAHRPAVHSRHDRALERLRDIFEALSPGTPVSLVQMGHRPRILLRSVGFEADRFDALLEGAGPTPERLQLEASLEELGGLVAELKAPARECYIVTDGQATTWGDLSEKARALIEQIAARARVFCIPTGSAGDDNVAVTGLEFASGSLQEGGMGRFLASVQNAGSIPREQVTVSLLVEDVAVDLKVIERLDPGEVADVSLYVRFESAGSLRLRAAVDEDPLVTDNSRHLVVEVRDRIRVICASGDSSPEPYGGEMEFLAIALTAGSSGADGQSVDVVTLPWLDLPSQPLSGADVLFLTNVPDVHPEEATRIFNFVRNGGGLFVFLGEATQPELLNEHLRTGSVRILPGELLERPEEAPVDGGGGDTRPPWVPGSGDGAAPPAAGLGLRVVSPGHPLGRALAGLNPGLVDEARFHHYVPVRLGEGGRAIWELRGTGLPLLSEKEIGRGSVLLLASSADRSWSNIVTHPLYPILLREAITYFTRRNTEQPVTVGEPLRASLSVTGEGIRWVLTDPRGVESPVQTVGSRDEGPVELPEAELPGFYRIEGTAESASPAHLAVNVDAAESAVRALRGEELAAALAGLPMRVVPEDEDLQAAIRESRIGRELWWELLIAALTLLVVEALLARWFARRMTPVGQGGS